MLDSNYIHGDFPVLMDRLTQLTSLSVVMNNFHGTIPDWLGTLTQLETLALSENTFFGQVSQSNGKSFEVVLQRYLSFVYTVKTDSRHVPAFEQFAKAMPR
jgi:hypothetical protein